MANQKDHCCYYYIFGNIIQSNDVKKVISMEHLSCKIAWACRRGMRELDLILLPFYEQHFTQLSEEQRQQFERLLMLDDNVLFECFFGQRRLDCEALQLLVEQIKQRQLL